MDNQFETGAGDDNSASEKESAVSEDEAKEAQIEPEFSLQVATDNMAAYLRITNAYHVKKLSYDKISDFLSQNNIVYGICEEDIKKFCESGKFFLELLCAKGLPYQDGTDGYLDYKFDPDAKLMPKAREDGTVDFRDLGLVRNIEKGTVLCEIVPPKEGKDGVDIYGRTVSFHPGRCPVLPVGSNTLVSEDKLSLIAEVDGCIECTKTRINVNDVFIVRGNVDSASGNIVAVGSVVIQGDVLEGFIVKAGKDISVRGIVEGATLEAGGNISISNGMNGMGRGKLIAEGSIIGKYFENAVIQAKGDVFSDVLMNCIVETESSIILQGRKASILGGRCTAGKRIFAKTIGTQSDITTYLSIQSTDVNSILVSGKEIYGTEELEKQKADLHKGFEQMQQKISEITRNIAESSAQDNEAMKKLLKLTMMKKAQLAAAIDSVEKQMKQAEEEKAVLTDYKIVVSSIVYPGTRVTIGPYNTSITVENSNTKLYADQNGIVFAPVLPSDVP